MKFFFFFDKQSHLESEMLIYIYGKLLINLDK